MEQAEQATLCVRCNKNPRQPGSGRKFDSMCRECRKEYAHAHYLKHKTKYNASAREWAKAHPGRHREYARNHWTNKGRDRRLKTLYGISAAEYDAAKESQNGACAICGDVSDKLHSDHNHETGKFRALLCNNCNWAIGLLREDPKRMRLAAKYIEKHRSR